MKQRGFIMTKDIEFLLQFKKESTNRLASNFQITGNDASNIVQLLETNNMVRFEAPEYVDHPASLITIDKQLKRDDLGITSHKAGNIIINTYLDWKKLAAVIVASVETVSGLSTASPFLVAIGIFSWILSISTLTDVKIAENGTAIIMALQQYKKHKVYATTQEQCMKDANNILSMHGYEEMNHSVFQDELTVLKKIKCIDILNGNIKLIEKVNFPF